MPDTILTEHIGKRRGDMRRVAAEVTAGPAAVSELVRGLSSDTADVRYGCAKVLRAISEIEPEALYERFGDFVELLGSERVILRWQATRIIANLARVDAGTRIEAVFDRYFAPIRGPVLVMAANIIKGSAAIARAKPHLAGRVVQALLSVEKGRYGTPECRNVALGHVIGAFDAIFEGTRVPRPVLALVLRQRRNTRNATRRKALMFLAKASRGQLPPSARGSVFR